MGDLVLVFLMGGLEEREAELRKILSGLLAASDTGVLIAKKIAELYECFAQNEVRHLVMHASRHAHYDFSHIPHLRVIFIDPDDTLELSTLPEYATRVRSLDELPQASDPPPPPSMRPDSQPPALRPDAPRKLWRTLMLAKADTLRNPGGWISQDTVAKRAGISALPNHVAALKVLHLHVQSHNGMMRLGVRPVTHELATRARIWAQATFQSNDELIVHREDADNRKLWGPDWDFSIALTLGEVALKPDPMGRFSYAVSVEIEGELGIFRNRAKEFLRHHFLDGLNRSNVAEQSQTLHAAMLAAVRKELKEAVSGKPDGMREFPMRWASGGSLLLVTWRGRRWALVFFRDIRPVGWNLANGASESVEEQAKILQLIERETMEEVVLLAGNPKEAASLDVIALELGTDLSILEERKALAARLLSRHHELRRSEDGLELRASERYVEVASIRGPGAIHLIEDGREKRAEHGLFLTIDPLDFGVEAIKLGTVLLEDDTHVLDGEVIEGSKARGERDRLARRPVGLLALSYLEECWREGQERSLGKVIHTDKDDPRLGGKELPPMKVSKDVASTDLFVFEHDYRWRLEHATDDGPYADDWLEKFGPDFEQLFEQQQASVNLRTLCPVTWKVLEQALASEHRSVFQRDPEGA